MKRKMVFRLKEFLGIFDDELFKILTNLNVAQINIDINNENNL